MTLGDFPVAYIVDKATRFKNQINVGLNSIIGIYEMCNLFELQYPDL